jgi:hypothetical protein
MTLPPPLTPAESEALCRDMLAAALDEFQRVTGVLIDYDTKDSDFAGAGAAQHLARAALGGHLAAALCRPAEAAGELRARHPREGG